MNTRTIITSIAAATAALSVGAALGSCGTNPSASPSSSPASSQAVAQDHNQADVSLAQGMIPHHAQAIAMSRLATQRAVSPR